MIRLTLCSGGYQVGPTLRIRPDAIESYVSIDRGGSVVYERGGHERRVWETPEQIDKLLEAAKVAKSTEE